MLNQKIIHLDADCFAASVERALRPGLRGKAVVVGRDAGGRGVVSCSSYEARAQGIWPGMPFSLAGRRLPSAAFLRENTAEYQRCSQLLLTILRSHAPVVEAASLDDFYLDVTGCESLFGGDLLRWARRLAGKIKRETGVPFSLGLAPNKLLARIATTLAKPEGAGWIFTGCERDFLAPVSAHLLPGLGEAMRERLKGFGVKTVGQLEAIGEEPLRLIAGSAGSELWKRCRGEFFEPVKPTALHRAISQSSSFSPDTADPRRVESAAVALAQEVIWRLRRGSLRCDKATLELTYSDGATVTRGITVGWITDQERDWIAPVRQAAAQLFTRRVRVRRLRLTAPFVPCQDGQFDLFQQLERRSKTSLTQAVDSVRERHGFKAIVSASALLGTPSSRLA